VRRALVLGLALLLTPSATAAPPTVTVQASATAGLAPLTVTLTAVGDAASFHWDLGDGTSAEGAVVQHVYAEPGAHTAVVTATSASSESAQARVVVTSYRLAFEAPVRGTWGKRGRFTGSLFPPVTRAPVTIVGPRGIAGRTRTRANGGFSIRARLRSRGPFRARVAGFESAEDSLTLRPRLTTRLTGTPTVGGRLTLVTRLRPAAAGTLVVRASGRTWTSARGVLRVRLPTRKVALFRIRVESQPAAGYLPARRTLNAAVALPRLGQGSRGASVLALERRLRELRYALPRVDRYFGHDTVEAVLAFQKMSGLSWSGRVDARVWRALARAQTPRPRLLRFRGSHIEVSKAHQVLMTVREGRVTQIVHVSTGATGNTPVGSWRVYRKVTGWDWVLWYPMYFLRGFAIHGYPSVPAYPASHGCVRVPMWIAPRLHAQNPHGRLVHIYW
jgi:N-acetylmuramoyl-L-alanine amidase